jgi:sugar lactone lactonase YvrE
VKPSASRSSAVRLGVAALGSALALAAPPAAVAAPDCPGGPPVTHTLLSGQGLLESVIVDRQGRLVFSNPDGLVRLDAPGSPPKLLTPIDSPGGLALDSDGTLFAGYGDSISNGLVGDMTGPSGLLRIDTDTGAASLYATGLSMANGVARAPDGSIYASNDLGANIDRIVDGQTERGWAHVQSGNGLAVDSTGRYLYVAQTFQPAAIQRVSLADPSQVTTYVAADPADAGAGLDGLVRDAADTLFAAANGAGQIWRIAGNPPQICVLLRGLPPFPDGPSAVAVGRGDGPFPAQNLYVVSFGGSVIEVEDVAVPEHEKGGSGKQRLRLIVRPRTVSAGESATFSVKTRVRHPKKAPIGFVRVRFAGQTFHTNQRGHARVEATFAHPGKRRARARLEGYKRAVAVVRVTP